MQERISINNKGSLKGAMVSKMIKEDAKSSKTIRKRQQTVVTIVARMNVGQKCANLRTWINVSNVIFSSMNLRVVQIRVALTGNGCSC